MERVNRTALVIVAASLFLTTGAARAGDPQPLTECNQEVSGDFYLPTDLDCTGADYGVTFVGRGTLDMRGFSIQHARLTQIYCEKRCSILGPGMVADTPDGSGIVSLRRKVRVQNVSLHDFYWEFFAIAAGSLELVDSDVNGSVYGRRRAVVENSTITGAACSGLVSGFYKSVGCGGGRVVVTNSTITGNVTNSPGSCGPKSADIATCASPELDEASSCGTSHKYGETETWGVCSSD